MSDPDSRQDPLHDGTVPTDADLGTAEVDETTNPPLPDGGPGRHFDDGPKRAEDKPTQDGPLLT